MDSAEPVNNLKPKRVAIFFTAADDELDDSLDRTVSEVIDDAEARGLFFEWGAVSEMDIEDVISGSPLHQALNGRPPDR